MSYIDSTTPNGRGEREKAQQAAATTLRLVQYDQEQALYAAHTTYTEAQESADPLVRVLSAIVLGSTYGTTGNHEKARDYFAIVEQLCRNISDKETIVEAFCFYAKRCYGSQNHDFALLYLSLGIDIARLSGLQHQQSVILNHMGRLYRQKDCHDEAVQCLQEALSLVSREEDPLQFGNTLLNLGNVYYRVGETADALHYYERALEVGKQENIDHLLAMGLNNIGMLYAVQGHYALALENFLQSESYHRTNQNASYATLLNNIGNIYEKMGYYDTAVEYHHKSLQLWQELEDTRGEASSLHNLGIVYNELEQYDKAEALCSLCIALCEKTDNQKTMALALSMLGNVRVHQGKPAEAVALLERSVAMTHALENRLDKASLLANLGSAYFHNGQPEQAITYLDEALAIATEVDLKEVLGEIHLSFSETYTLLNQPEKAFQHFQSYHTIDKEITAQITSQKAQTLQIQHNVEQARKEAEIYRLKNTELAETLSQLEEANNRLEELNNEKNDLMGIVSHDLKNPLNNIMMLANLLHKEHNLSLQEIHDFSSDILSSAGRMFALITSLLDNDLLESKLQNIPLRSYNITPLLLSVLHQYIPHAERKELALHQNFQDEPLLAYTDHDTLLQVLDNLVSNAVKFSPPNRNIWVTAYSSSGSSTPPAFVCISVRDEGPGLQESDKKRLFQKFAKLSATPTAGEHSTGLGLSIVKRLVDALHGTIRCESEPGEGATFTVELPAFTPHPNQQKQAAQAQ